MPIKSNLKTKVFGVPLQKQFAKNMDGTLIVNGYFTSDRKDEVGDIITRDATLRALPKYRQWGNIRYMHQPKPVAKVIKIGEEDGLAWNETQIKVIDPQAVFEVENGLLNAMSVGILVNFDDIQEDEDGGWIINDYSLAEISLVDHPANYDARLKSLDVEQGLRYLARSYGFESLAQGIQNMLDMELAMDTKDEKEFPQEEPEAETKESAQTEVDKSPACRKADESKDDCVSRKIPEIMAENPDMKQQQAIAIAESMCSKSCDEKEDIMEEEIIETETEDVSAEKEIAAEEMSDETIEKEAVLEETPEEPVGEEVEKELDLSGLIEEEPAEETEEVLPEEGAEEELEEDELTPQEIRGMFEQLAMSIEALAESMKAFAESAKTQAEAPKEIEEQVVGDVDVEKAIAKQEDNEPVSVPVNRSGGIPATTLPSEETEQKDADVQEEHSLADALRKYMRQKYT